MSRFKAYPFDMPVTGVLDLVGVVDDAKDVAFILEDRATKRFSISFYAPFAYCKMNESYALIPLEFEEGATLSSSPIYVGESGAFLEFFDKNSHGVCRDQGRYCYAIFTLDDVIYIVSDDEPTITVMGQDVA